MASRAFYLVSTALLGGTALLVWLAVSAGSPAAPAASVALEAPPPAVDRRVLGIVGADHDPAHLTVEAAPAERGAHGSALAFTTTETHERPRPPAPAPAPPEPPLAGDPALNAASEASAAAQSKVLAELRRELERRSKALRKACWPPGSDFAATYTVEATYGAEGELLALGVSDVSGMPGVGTCLMNQLTRSPLVLSAPPGVAVAVAAPLVFAGTETPPPPKPRSADTSPEGSRPP